MVILPWKITFLEISVCLWARYSKYKAQKWPIKTSPRTLALGTIIRHSTSPYSSTTIEITKRKTEVHRYRVHHYSPRHIMDALFGRINVRDLLSTHDLTDPTAPLSAPDLRLLISRLESHSLQIKSKVQSYLLSHKDDFATLFSLCNDAVSRTDRISVDLEDILRLVSDRQVDAEVRLVVEELREKTREARVKKEALEIVRVVVAIEERLKGVREGVKNGQLGFAAQEVRELKKALRIGDEDEKEPIVYGLLRQEWHDCLEEVTSALFCSLK